MRCPQCETVIVHPSPYFPHFPYYQESLSPRVAPWRPLRQASVFRIKIQFLFCHRRCRSRVHVLCKKPRLNSDLLWSFRALRGCSCISPPRNSAIKLFLSLSVCEAGIKRNAIAAKPERPVPIHCSCFICSPNGAPPALSLGSADGGRWTIRKE